MSVESSATHNDDGTLIAKGVDDEPIEANRRIFEGRTLIVFAAAATFYAAFHMAALNGVSISNLTGGAVNLPFLPSLPLELLHVRNQQRFVIVGTYADQVNGCKALRLEMEEVARPTLIQRPEGGDMPSKVSAWVEPKTGRLCRAEVRTKDAQLGAFIEALIRVEFRYDAGVEMMVPAKLYEVFFDPPRNRGDGEATYGNYRRFRTSGRLVPGPE